MPSFAMRILVTLISLAWGLNSFAVPPPTAEQMEFFENRIRPVLVEQCYACHNETKSKEGGLALDHREGVLKGGEHGPILVPGQPQKSSLLAILRHQVPNLKMPQGSAKLDDQVIADFERWIEMNAPDPRDVPPTERELDQFTSWETLFEKRKKWWSLQSIEDRPIPTVTRPDWSNHPVDRFVLAKLEEQGLEPTSLAPPEALVRRIFFAIVGLPPTELESRHWVSILAQPNGLEQLVDHLLESPHYGERWARYWMDWIRYADSHGSEGDPPIENGWLYRDYLIRALNSDVPYDQLVREHIAGDLLEDPRQNNELGINESIVGTAHWRMVFHGFSPTDALDEKVRFIDDQINAFSKCFLGLTVSCARCHDHKFDAISQKDYYALFGIFNACRPGRSTIDLPDKIDLHRDVLLDLKKEIRSELAQWWLSFLPELRENLLDERGSWTNAKSPKELLHAWLLFRKELTESQTLEAAWRNQFAAKRVLSEDQEVLQRLRHWKLDTKEDCQEWNRTGSGFKGFEPSPAGEFSIATHGEKILSGIYPSGLYSHPISAKHSGRITSPDIQLDGEFDLWLRVIGEGGATARYVVHDYPRRGTVFPAVDIKNEWHWQKLDMSYWDGDSVHVELATAMDGPLMVKNEARSWFGITEALISRKGEPPPSDSRSVRLLETSESDPPRSLEEAADRTIDVLRQALLAWSAGSISNDQASLLDLSLKQGVLPNRIESKKEASKEDSPSDSKRIASIATLIDRYRTLENEIIVPTRIPTLEETTGRSQRLYVRGNHKEPAEHVPPGFLSALGTSNYPRSAGARLSLADDLVASNNPLLNRVIVNRIWHHLFGKGIVPSPDNFGRLGQLPTHPELLDHLACQFSSKGSSIKQLIRYLVTSKTWQLSSQPTSSAIQKDPNNHFWSHASVRRLEAEAIRDSLLAVSGGLRRDLFGPPVDGRSDRRSIYIRVTRNALDPFLRAFDFPEPLTTVGRRDVTNVPAQSLALLNDEQISNLAMRWTSSILDGAAEAKRDRVERMFREALGRSPSNDEILRSLAYVEEMMRQEEKRRVEIAHVEDAIQRRKKSIAEITEPIRLKLIGEKKGTKEDAWKVPKPIGSWNFQDSLQDHTGALHCEAKQGAVIGPAGLTLDGKGYLVSSPLTMALKAKTLEAWVRLKNLDQRAGGVMSVQSKEGGHFDAIVYAEQKPFQWLAGSNHFQRTQPFQGVDEKEAVDRVVHLAISYHLDGTIIGYRDGVPYGTPYKSQGPHPFEAGETVVSFGVRHLPAGGNKMLQGEILHARLYDRALGAEEVLRSFQAIGKTVTDRQIEENLSEEQRSEIEALRKDVAISEKRLAELGPVDPISNELGSWRELAKAIFTFKEFIFLK